jgi:hypothetical protein
VCLVGVDSLALTVNDDAPAMVMLMVELVDFEGDLVVVNMGG